MMAQPGSEQMTASMLQSLQGSQQGLSGSAVMVGSGSALGTTSLVGGSMQATNLSMNDFNLGSIPQMAMGSYTQGAMSNQGSQGSFPGFPALSHSSMPSSQGSFQPASQGSFPQGSAAPMSQTSMQPVSEGNMQQVQASLQGVSQGSIPPMDFGSTQQVQASVHSGSHNSGADVQNNNAALSQNSMAF